MTDYPPTYREIHSKTKISTKQDLYCAHPPPINITRYNIDTTLYDLYNIELFQLYEKLDFY